jgi:hypothetical protein
MNMLIRDQGSGIREQGTNILTITITIMIAAIGR